MHLIKDENGNPVLHGHEHTHSHGEGCETILTTTAAAVREATAGMKQHAF